MVAVNVFFFKQLYHFVISVIRWWECWDQIWEIGFQGPIKDRLHGQHWTRGRRWTEEGKTTTTIILEHPYTLALRGKAAMSLDYTSNISDMFLIFSLCPEELLYCLLWAVLWRSPRYGIPCLANALWKSVLIKATVTWQGMEMHPCYKVPMQNIFFMNHAY